MKDEGGRSRGRWGKRPAPAMPVHGLGPEKEGKDMCQAAALFGEA